MRYCRQRGFAVRSFAPLAAERDRYTDGAKFVFLFGTRGDSTARAKGVQPATSNWLTNRGAGVFLALLRTTGAIRGVSERASARAALAASGRSASFGVNEVDDGRGHPRPSSAHAGLR